MSIRYRGAVAAALTCLTALLPVHSAAVAASEPAAPMALSALPQLHPVLTLQEAISFAERYNPTLQLLRYQVANSRSSLATAPANAAALAPTAALLAQAQFGLNIPESAISPQATIRQAQIGVEQAAAQFDMALQQIRLATVQAYVEWQRATALVAAQESGLERALSQQANVEISFGVGLVARYDLLQAQSQTAGQRAALSGAIAMQAGARHGLEQIVGRTLLPSVTPEPMVLSSEEIALETDVVKLTARAMANRPDLRQTQLDLAARRLQTGLVVGNSPASLLQLQMTALQLHSGAIKAQTEVLQAMLNAQGSLEELKARESALSPAREALRLAELRYESGIATYLEVQSAFASALQAEANRIQAAANLTLGLARLAQATGDL